MKFRMKISKFRQNLKAHSGLHYVNSEEGICINFSTKILKFLGTCWSDPEGQWPTLCKI